MRKLLIGIGALLIAGAVIWKVGLAALAFAFGPPMLKNRGTKTVEGNPAKTATSEVKAAL